VLSLRYYNQRDIRLEMVDMPVPGSDEVLLRVTDAGISQTQINEFIEGPFIIDKTPLIPCQEFGGVVENCDIFDSKKFYAVLPLISCGECNYCKNGLENLCEKLSYYGLIGRDGGFAQYCAVKKANLFEVDKRELLTFIEPILVGIHSANQYRKIGEIENKNVLVLGAGAVGVSVAAVWRDYFKADVKITDNFNSRLLKAKEFGLDIIQKDDIKCGYDIVIDAAGMDTSSMKSALKEGFGYLKKGGVLINIGTYFHPLPIIPSKILLKEQFMITSILYNRKDIAILSDVLNDLMVDFDKLINIISLKDIIENGYYAIEIDKSNFTRIVVRPY